MAAMIFTNRTLGYVNAPALMQRLLPLVGIEHVAPIEYQRKRDLLYKALIEYGYSPWESLKGPFTCSPEPR